MVERVRQFSTCEPWRQLQMRQRTPAGILSRPAADPIDVLGIAFQELWQQLIEGSVDESGQLIIEFVDIV